MKYDSILEKRIMLLKKGLGVLDFINKWIIRRAIVAIITENKISF